MRLWFVAIMLEMLGDLGMGWIYLSYWTDMNFGEPVGRLWPPQRWLPSNPRTCDYVSFQAKGVFLIWLRTLRWRKFTGLFRWALCNHRLFIIERGNQERQSQRRMGNRRQNYAEPWPKKCRHHLEAIKSKEMDCPAVFRKKAAFPTYFIFLNSRNLKL